MPANEGRRRRVCQRGSLWWPLPPQFATIRGREVARLGVDWQIER